MKEKIKLYIQQACIGKNVITCRAVPINMANVNLHWAKKAAWKQAWEDEVGWAVLAQRKNLGKLPLKKPKITIIIKSTHLKDIDGLYNSTKPLWDGLRKAGVIVDDNPDGVRMKVKQLKVKHKNEEGVEIEIEKN